MVCANFITENLCCAGFFIKCFYRGHKNYLAFLEHYLQKTLDAVKVKEHNSFTGSATRTRKQLGESCETSRPNSKPKGQQNENSSFPCNRQCESRSHGLGAVRSHARHDASRQDSAQESRESKREQGGPRCRVSRAEVAPQFRPEGEIVMEKFFIWFEANKDALQIIAEICDWLIKVALLISAFHFIIKFW